MGLNDDYSLKLGELEMANIKYTKDGKKVSVVGKLNSQETIVQEIYVTENSEIPAGEQFIVKTLLDEPIISWHQRETKAWETKYEETKTSCQREISTLNQTLRRERDVLRQLIKQTKTWQTSLSDDVFQNIFDLMSGDITHLVKNDWDYEIIEFNKCIADPINRDNDYDLKLLTLFGNGESFKWKINRWKDGPGSNYAIFPCKSFEEAKNKVCELMIADTREESISERMIKAKDKYNLSYPTQDLINKYYISINKAMENQIEKFKEDIKKAEQKIEANINSIR